MALMPLRRKEGLPSTAVIRLLIIDGTWTPEIDLEFAFICQQGWKCDGIATQQQSQTSGYGHAGPSLKLSALAI